MESVTRHVGRHSPLSLARGKKLFLLVLRSSEKTDASVFRDDGRFLVQCQGGSRQPPDFAFLHIQVSTLLHYLQGNFRAVRGYLPKTEAA